MPWTTADVDRFKKGLTPKQKRAWVHIANDALSRCTKAGKKSHKACEGSAIRQANKVAGKELEMTDVTEEVLDETQEKDVSHEKEQDEKGYVPWGDSIISFSDLDSLREAEEMADQVRDITGDFMGLSRNIMYSNEITDKGSAIKSLADEFSRRVKMEVKSIELDTQLGGEFDEAEEELDVKAKWSRAYINSLPSSAFLSVEANCDTKACRHFPYKDSSGKVDIPHIRNAIARIPQSKFGLSTSQKTSLQNRARRILANAQKERDYHIMEESLVQKVLPPAVQGVIKDAVDEVPIKDTVPEILIWKEADGSYRWVARYSNNFRDDDSPAEIIAAKSHQRFVELVDKGEYPMPDLLVWHTPQWKIGQADWVAYDDTGFALATGVIDKEFSELAEALMIVSPEKIKMSHGMPNSSIVRDPDDETIIVEHQSKEITILPAWAAANKITGWMLTTKEEQMIPTDKKNTLEAQWSLGPQVLEFVEASNVEAAAKAQEEEIESKEASPPEVPTEEGGVTATDTSGTSVSAPVVETEKTDEAPKADVEAKEAPADEGGEAKEAPEAKEETGDITREEIAQGIQKAQEPVLEWQLQVNSVLENLVKEIKELSKSEDEKIADKLKKTPLDSISDLVVQSVIGNPATHVDGRTSFGKLGPKETPPQGEKDNVPLVTGVGHIDSLFQAKESAKEQ